MQGTHVPQLLESTPEPVSHNDWVCVPQLLKPAHPKACAPEKKATVLRSPCTTTEEQPCLPQLEKVRMQQKGRSGKKKKKKKKYNFPRLNQKETENMNRPTTSNQVETY